MVLFFNQTAGLRGLTAGRKEGTFVRIFTLMHAYAVIKYNI